MDYHASVAGLIITSGNREVRVTLRGSEEMTSFSSQDAVTPLCLTQKIISCYIYVLNVVCVILMPSKLLVNIGKQVYIKLSVYNVI